MQQEHDETARAQLIEHNLRLVAHIVKKYYAASAEQDDLISIGTIGLIKAVGTFRPDKNIRLATYASKCIQNELLMHFRQKRKTAGELSLSDALETDGDGNALALQDVLSCEGRGPFCGRGARPLRRHAPRAGRRALPARARDHPPALRAGRARAAAPA